VHLEDIVSGEVRWIGLHLVRHFCDELQYNNLGRQGQQIVIKRRLTGEKPQNAPQEHVAPFEQATVPVKALIRRMLPKEAAAVSRLAYIAYNYSYPYEHIYDPEQVRALNETNRLISYLAINQGNDEIIGHAALVPDSIWMPISAATFPFWHTAETRCNRYVESFVTGVLIAWRRSICTCRCSNRVRHV
jgi:hypothetical protein